MRSQHVGSLANQNEETYTLRRNPAPYADQVRSRKEQPILAVNMKSCFAGTNPQVLSE